jgi:hypothetical protein
MRTDKELKDLLQSIVPGVYDPDEEDQIVAEASVIFSKTLKSEKRTATAACRESRMMDALLQSMGNMDRWDEDDHLIEESFEGLDPDQIVRRIASSTPKSFKNAYGDHMDILNDDDISVFFRDEDPEDPTSYDINDSEEAHSLDVFSPFGKPKHWSDSQRR